MAMRIVDLPSGSADAAGDVVTAQPRQADVEEHHLRLESRRDVDGFDAVVRSLHFVPFELERAGEAVDGILIVVDGEDPMCADFCLVRLGSRRGRRRPSAGTSLTNGKRITNSLPWSAPSLWASMVPPWSSTSRRTSVRPMPSPPCERSSERSTCVNISNTWPSMSAGMPMPLSRMRMATSCRRPLVDTASAIRPPAGVYLAALLSTLSRTCASRVGSAWTQIGSAGTSTVNSCR